MRRYAIILTSLFLCYVPDGMASQVSANTATPAFLPLDEASRPAAMRPPRFIPLKNKQAFIPFISHSAGAGPAHKKEVLPSADATPSPPVHAQKASSSMTHEQATQLLSVFTAP